MWIMIEGINAMENGFLLANLIFDENGKKNSKKPSETRATNFLVGKHARGWE